MGQGRDGGIRVLGKRASKPAWKKSPYTIAAYKFQEFGLEVFTLEKIEMAEICVDTELGTVQQIPNTSGLSGLRWTQEEG
jgi:hypothetical protein